jgi:FKBP-type peptidyl-prolyl cis-trans isomerase
MFFFVLVLGTVHGQGIPLTKDGKVTKVLIRDGYGRSPQENDKAVIHYTGYLSDGTSFDSSRGRQGFHFTIGKSVIRGWSIGVQSMRVGEVSNFTIDYDYGYGETGYPPIIPAKSQLQFEIELLDIIQ